MKFKHGDRVTCEIDGEYIDDARISIDMDGTMYLCQSDFLTFNDNADNMFGHSDSNVVSGCFDYYKVKLKEKTIDNLEVGDVLVTSAPDFYKGRERKVLAICGLVYFLSGVDTFTKYDGGYTIEEIKYMHTLKKEEEPEVPEELTMAELEKELGRKVKIIK